MKAAKIIGILLVILVTAFSGLVSAQDDEFFPEIPVLVDGDSVTGEFLDNVTARLYGFSASEGDRISISMTQISPELDPYLLLLGERGQVLTDDDDSGELEFSAHIRNFLIPASGSYYVLATSYNYRDNIFIEAEQVTPPEEPLKYTLAIDGIRPATRNETLIEMARGALEFGVEARGGSSPREPVFYYGFVGMAGQTIDIAIQSEEFDTALHLFAPGGDRIAVSDDEFPNQRLPNAAIRNLELPVDGLYILFATDVFFYNAGKTLQGQNFVGGRFILNLDEVIGE
jgi:hypothetical protein